MPVFFCILASAEAGRGSDLLLGVQIGFPRHLGAYREYLEDGVSWGGVIYSSLASNVELGLGISYTDWNIVDGNRVDALSFSRHYTSLGWETGGSGKITEVSFSLRLLSSPVRGTAARVFVQLGIGYYWIDLDSEYHNPSLCLAPNYSGTCSYYISYDDQSFGMDISVGAVIPVFEHMMLEIQPSLRIVPGERGYEEDYITYASIDLGVKYKVDLESAGKP